MFEIKQDHYWTQGSPNPRIQCARCLHMFEADHKKLYDGIVLDIPSVLIYDKENLMCDKCADETGYQDHLSPDKPKEALKPNDNTPRECATCAGVGDVMTGTPCGTCYGHGNWRKA